MDVGTSLLTTGNNGQNATIRKTALFCRQGTHRQELIKFNRAAPVRVHLCAFGGASGHRGAVGGQAIGSRRALAVCSPFPLEFRAGLSSPTCQTFSLSPSPHSCPPSISSHLPDFNLQGRIPHGVAQSLQGGPQLVKVNHSIACCSV